MKDTAALKSINETLHDAVIDKYWEGQGLYAINSSYGMVSLYDIKDIKGFDDFVWEHIINENRYGNRREDIYVSRIELSDELDSLLTNAWAGAGKYLLTRVNADGDTYKSIDSYREEDAFRLGVIRQILNGSNYRSIERKTSLIEDLPTLTEEDARKLWQGPGMYCLTRLGEDFHTCFVLKRCYSEDALVKTFNEFQLGGWDNQFLIKAIAFTPISDELTAFEPNHIYVQNEIAMNPIVCVKKTAKTVTFMDEYGHTFRKKLDQHSRYEAVYEPDPYAREGRSVMYRADYELPVNDVTAEVYPRLVDYVHKHTSEQ